MKVLILVLLVVAMAVSHPDPRRKSMTKRTHTSRHAPTPNKKVTGGKYWNPHTARNAIDTITAAVDAGRDIYDIINRKQLDYNQQENNNFYDQQNVQLTKEDMKEVMQEMMQAMVQAMVQEMMQKIKQEMRQELLQLISQTNNEASAPESDTDNARDSSTSEMIEE